MIFFKQQPVLCVWLPRLNCLQNCSSSPEQDNEDCEFFSEPATLLNFLGNLFFMGRTWFPHPLAWVLSHSLTKQVLCQCPCASLCATLWMGCVWYVEPPCGTFCEHFMNFLHLFAQNLTIYGTVFASEGKRFSEKELKIRLYRVKVCSICM